jgi:imidazolonepropionase
VNNTVIVRGARQLVTLRGPAGPRRGPALRELSVIPDGALLLCDGLVVEAGPSRRIENLASARRASEIDATGRVIIPAFVDCDSQIVFAHSTMNDRESRVSGNRVRGPADAREAILAGSRALRSVSARTLKTRAQTVVAGMARHGTCTIAAKTGYGVDSRGDLKTLRVQAELNRDPLNIVSTYLGANVIPREHESNPDAYLNAIVGRVLPTVARRHLAAFAGAQVGPAGFTVEQARRYLEAAKRLGLGLKLSGGQFLEDGSVELAVELAALSIGHLEYISSAAIGILARSAVTGVLLPGAVFQMNLDRYAPARAMIDAGAAVALGSSFNPDTSPSYNMQMILTLGCRYLGMCAAEVISAATINAAYAIGRGARSGSLEPGKDADMLMLNVRDYREIPYHAGVNSVHMTVKRGVVIYKEGGIENWLTA